MSQRLTFGMNVKPRNMNIIMKHNIVQTASSKLGLLATVGLMITININMTVEKYMMVAEYLASLSASTSTFLVRKASTSPIM